MTSSSSSRPSNSENTDEMSEAGITHLNLGSVLPHSKAILLGQAAAQVSGKVISIAAGIGDEYARRAGSGVHGFELWFLYS